MSFFTSLTNTVTNTSFTNTVKLTAFSWKFQTKGRFLWVNKSKITVKNTFNEDNLAIAGNHEANKDKKSLFWVFLQICCPCFTP